MPDSISKRLTQVNSENDEIPEQQGNQVGYCKPPAEHQFKPGRSGNPRGRAPNAGSSVIEYLNQMAADELTEAEVRAIAKDSDERWTKRSAAMLILKVLEAGDIADFAALFTGEKTVSQLRAEGVDTSLIKRYRKSQDGVSIELYDRSGQFFDRLLDRTDGRPRQSHDITSGGEAIVLAPIVLDGPTQDLANALAQRMDYLSDEQE